MKMTRRELLEAAIAGSVAVAPELTAQEPAALDLTALANVQLPPGTEPAFAFKA